MGKRYRVVHFINQFFAQIGGEEKADLPPSTAAGPVGPGLAFQAALGDAFEIAATLICGDNYFATHGESLLPALIEEIRSYAPDVVIAGPAFNAGRYGPNCGALCAAVQRELGIPAVTGMYCENPGVDLYRRDCYIIETQNSAVGMRRAVPAMSALVKKLLRGQAVSPAGDGYFAKGIKRNVFVEKTGADRAIDMLLAKLAGRPYQSELVFPDFERVPPAPPVRDLTRARLALVTDAGLTDRQNSARLESARATKFLELNIGGMDTLSPERFGSVHGGFDTTAANRNPNVLVPLDLVRGLVRQGRAGGLLDTIYSTTGNGTSLKNAQRFGAEIAAKLRAQQVDAVILTST